MKKYLFGLGAILVGAGMMFVLVHGEVRADIKDDSKTDFLCHEQSVEESARYGTIFSPKVLECKKENTTCYITVGKSLAPSISCVKEEMFK